MTSGSKGLWRPRDRKPATPVTPTHSQGRGGEDRAPTACRAEAPTACRAEAPRALHGHRELRKSADGVPRGGGGDQHTRVQPRRATSERTGGAALGAHTGLRTVYVPAGRTGNLTFRDSGGPHSVLGNDSEGGEREDLTVWFLHCSRSAVTPREGRL